MSATATGGHDGGIEARRRLPRIPARLLRLASDDRLVELLRGGSEAAFEVIYTRHHRGVLSFCRHMLGSVDEAEDALQHTFLSAYRGLLASGKPIQLRPWLYTIARNRCLSVLRARRERTPDELVEPSTEQLSHEVEQRHDLRAMLGDLAALPADQRAALVLAELGDMSHDEIGHVLGCEREKVKALVFQARSSLIASRTARETPCAEIREQLANLRGGSLRRNTLRRHLRECEGCREFGEQVRAQRDALALILPVAPSLGLKATVLGVVGVGAAAGGSGSVVATTAVVLAVAGGGAAVVDVARDDQVERKPRPAKVAPAADAPEAAAPRPASPTTRRGAGPADRGRAEGQRVRRRGAKRERAAAGGAHGLKPGTRGKGATPPKAARPDRAQGPPVARPLKARGPKPKAERVRVARPKAEKVRGPKPRVDRARAPERVPQKPARATEREPTRAEEPASAEAVAPSERAKAG